MEGVSGDGEMGYGRESANVYVKYCRIIQRWKICEVYALKMRIRRWIHMQLAEGSRQNPGAQHALASDVRLG